MKILLLQDVAGVGKKGQVVSVADGFALNSLIPKSKAAVATAEIQHRVEAEVKAKVDKEAKQEFLAKELKAKIEKRTITVKAKVGDKGALFGAIHEKQIADALSKEIGREILKTQIVIPHPIKTLGEHQVLLKLDRHVEATVKVNVVG